MVVSFQSVPGASSIGLLSRVSGRLWAIAAEGGPCVSEGACGASSIPLLVPAVEVACGTQYIPSGPPPAARFQSGRWCRLGDNRGRGDLDIFRSRACFLSQVRMPCSQA